MRRYASAHGLLESMYDPSSSTVTPSQLKALLSGPSTVTRSQSDQADAGMSTSTVQTLAPMGSSQALNSMGPMSSGAGTNLPVSLQIGDYKVWDYLVEVMSRGWSDAGSFRLSPAYSLYLALRFFHSHSKPYLMQFFTRIAHHMNQISQECTSRDELLFWLANASELSFLVDRDPGLRTPRSGQLDSVVETVFRRLCTVLLGALRPACKPMLDVNIPIEDGSNELLTLLDGTLRAARACRLNAALTIQLCSHVLHAINATLFNSLVGVTSNTAHLTTRLGKCLQARLAAVHGIDEEHRCKFVGSTGMIVVFRWAEQMGVELAAECHLDRSRQAAALLAAQKNDVAALGATCYKLNSLQVRYLLTHFSAQDGEIPCDNDVISRVIGLSERQADALTIQDGHPITLAESEQLLLPFLLPQDGYTAEQLKGVPDGLVQYLLSLQDKGLCHSVSVLESVSPTWAASSVIANTPAMQRPAAPAAPQTSPPAPVKPMVARSSSQSTLTSLPTTQFGDSFGSMGDDVIRVVLKRGSGGIGLSIVAAQGVGDRQVGIYVKKVVPGSPAASDGRLAAGDQLLSVNGQSLLGISQEEAAEYMARAGAEVRFDVRKGAAMRNGLSAWLCQPPPPTVSDEFFQPVAPVQQHQTSFPAHQQSTLPPMMNFNGSYSNYAPLPSYGSQMSMQTTNSYQKHQPSTTFAPSVRTSAFAPVSVAGGEPNRHVRSVSASDLYQSDPNASYSQRSPNPLQQQGYSSAATRESNNDLYRASQPSSPPAAHSSPREDHRVPSTAGGLPPINTSYSSSLPVPLNRSNYANANHTQHTHAQATTRNIPVVRYHRQGPTSPSSIPNGSVGGYAKPPNYSNPSTARSPEAVVVRPIELPIHREDASGGAVRIREDPRSTTTFGVMAPTAFTQALQAGGTQEARVVLAPPRSSGFERELRNLERTNTALVVSLAKFSQISS
ncbi:PDZ/DHR/GLGF domain protein [Ancylostoma caninum]|uniref:PDZ/DHR/GLGF domain protein n=1 Tax=Ancylostoma caninum TaxID=29170 RepID=A0A368FDM8_ANCCA|nr:PDZ/DHR/GLGF domain protein [Ancylostoma caninum]